MTTAIFVRRVMIHPQTGHISLRVQSRTTDGARTWDGPVKDYGFDAHVYAGRFGGETEQLLKYVVSEHKAFIGRHNALTEELTQLEGKQIG